MKKTYSKPQIMFESFSLSTSIAGDCGVKTDAPAAGTCGMEYGDMGTIFLTDVAGCSIVFGIDDGFFNGICYHVPVQNLNLFNS